MKIKIHYFRFFRGRSGSCGFVDYEKFEKHNSVSESSDLASSPPISSYKDKDDDIGVVFKIEESDNDNESRCSTATSDDSGLGRVGQGVCFFALYG